MENKSLIAASSSLMLVFLAGLILRLAKPVFFPIFLAIFFYFILSPALDWLLRLRIPKPLAVFLIIISSFLALYLLGTLFYASGKGFAASLPEYGQKLNSLLRSIMEKLRVAKISWDPSAWAKSLDVNRVAALVVSSLDKFLSFFSTLILIYVLLIFMLAGRGKLKAKINRSFPVPRAVKVNQVIDNIDSQIQKYLIIKTGISFLSGLFTLIVLLIFGVDFAVVFGFLTFVLNFIPSLGSIIAIGLSSLVAAFQFGSFLQALWILLILVFLDAIMANFLEPKLMGRGLGLSPLTVLFSLFFWGWLWGIPGMILAVPLVAVIKIVCSNIPSLRFLAEIMSK